MCGIVAIVGDLALRDEIAIKRMLVLDYFRGTDSTGFAAVRIMNDDVKLAKAAVDPIELFQMPSFRDALHGSASKAFIGHNRAATRGGVNRHNAHPFSIGDIVGAHNGTLDYQSTKALEDALGMQYPVDSEALFAAINQFGIDDTVKMLTKGKDYTTGAWSLVWYDKSEGSLNLLRNEWRPMWYAYEEGYKRIFLASEWPMIEAAAELGGYKLAADKEGYKFLPTEEDVHYKFSVDLLRKGSATRPKPVAKACKAKEPKSSSDSAADWRAAQDFFPSSELGQDNEIKIGKEKTHGRSGDASGRSSNILHIFGDLHNPLGGFIDKKVFEELAKYGCSWCQQDVEYEDEGIMIYDRDDVILCADCVRGNEDARSRNTRIVTKTPLNLVDKIINKAK